MQLMQRRIGQVIRIQPHPDLDPATPVGELFVKPLGVLLIQTQDNSARFAVYADERMLVVEDELLNPE